MRTGYGYHLTPCDRGGGGGGGSGKGGSGSLVIAAVVVVVIVGLASTHTAARVAYDVLDVIAWSAAGLFAAAVATVTAVVLVRRRRRRRARVHELPAYVPPVRLVRSRRVWAIERARTLPGEVMRDPAELDERRPK